ncbi:MAG: aromatic ring-hydroxylating dioxygenase subunit alpha [Gammaproteobacteria bacterium]|nr:aromatic ring-hydroxylating dioxygenase subunit alpha [Gammaproteobacteria bacterium]
MTGYVLPPPVAGLEPTLPSSWYRSEKIFGLEKERIFFREWLCVGREEEVPSPGSHRVLDILGESVILVRNRKDQLRAFYNVCRHRGSRLCRTDGGITASRIVCPYHQWTYDLDGHLLAAPYLTTEPGFDKSLFSLYPIGVETWGGFVFLNLTPANAKPFLEQVTGIPERTRRYPLSELRIGHTIEYQVAANWKVLCENYNECYHCAGVHPELCAIVPAFRDRGGSNLDWERGIPHREGAYTFTKSGTTRRRAFPTLNEDEQVRHKGELLYPNLFVSLACDHVAVFILRPRSPGRTDITCHFLFEPFELQKPDFDPSDTVEFWDVVNRQDWVICERVQEGISSRVHERGYYAPMEDFNLDIRRYVLDRIGDSVPAGDSLAGRSVAPAGDSLAGRSVADSL